MTFSFVHPGWTLPAQQFADLGDGSSAATTAELSAFCFLTSGSSEITA